MQDLWMGGRGGGADPGFLKGGGGPSQARIQDFLKGGEDIHKPAPPLGHCPRDVIHPPEN